jgi:NDP-sugar pyrophosphorylase family protein
VDRVLVVVNYLAEQIAAYLAEQRHFADHLVVRQEVPRGTGDALRSCRPYIRSDRFLALNGDDLFGARDLAALAGCTAGVLVHPVEDPDHWGIAYRRPDGTLERLVEKPAIEGRQMANTGAYLFPKEVFDSPLSLSARGEYEITDYVTALAQRQPVQLIEAKFWVPIGTTEIWQAVQNMQIEEQLRPRR